MADAQGKFVATEPLFEDLPRGWVSTTLGKLVGRPRGKIAADASSALPFLGMDHVEADGFGLLGQDVFSNMKSAGSPFFPGDVLYGRLRPYLNKVHHARFAGVASAEFIVMPASNSFDARFLMYRLHHRRFVQFAMERSSGDRPRVKFDAIAEYRFGLPPPAEQRRIVSRIDELFSRIEAGERAIAAARAALKRYRKSILKAAVTGTLTADWREKRGEPNETGHQLLARTLKDREQLAKRDLSLIGVDDAAYELPSCWAWATLDRLTVIKGGVTVDRKKLPDDPVTLPYLRVANVQDGRIDLSEIKEITVERKKADDCLLRNGDILLNEGGDLDKLGRGWVWEEQIAPCIHQNHVFRARPVNADINPYFVSHYANTMGRTFFMDKGKHSVNLASISLTEVSKLPVPLPPADEQTEIVSRVEEALSRIDHAEATLNVQARNARALKQSVLKAAFEGRLVPQDPNEELAIGIVARTAGERSALKTTTKARA